MRQDFLQIGNRLAIQNGDFVLTTDNTAVAQRVKRMLLLFKGEYWLNLDLGVPYYEGILGKKNSLETVQSLFINAIKSVAGVKEVLSFDLSFDDKTRELSLETTILDDLNQELEIEI